MTTIDSVAGVVGVFGLGDDPETGPGWTNDTPTLKAGDFSLAFNLTNPPIRQRINVDLAARPLNLAPNRSTNYTLQAWVKLGTRVTQDRMVVYRSAGDGPRVSLSIHNNRALHTTVYGNTDFTTGIGIPNDNRWHHIAAVMENNFARVNFFLDGILRQTVNRTATGAASSSGAPGLLIGMESDNRYFTGLLDRISISDTSLGAAALDYPAAPGLATFTSLQSHPQDVLADIGSTVSFEAFPSTTGATVHWRHRLQRSDLTGRDLPDASMAINRVIITNVTLADRGFYSIVLSNSAGVAESYSAMLEVRTAPGALQRMWEILPGDRPYLTGWNSSAGSRDLERGMAYNPVTDHLLIGARVSSPTIKGIYIINAQTGAHVGELNGTSAVAGGTIVLTRVVVADDGAIYACNFGTLTDANPLKIYRWASETAPGPTLAYQGNPAAGVVANQQWGKNMIVRGGGAQTQILMDTRTTVFALFTTTDGESFTPSIIQSDAYDEAGAGIAWGEGNTFWGKSPSEALTLWNLDAASQTATSRRWHLDFPSENFGNFTFSADRRYFAGLKFQDGPDAVELYDASNITNQAPVLLDTALFTPDNDHALLYGNVVISSNRVFALNPNNGMTAFRFTPPSTERPVLTIKLSGNAVLTWPATVRGFVLEATDNLSTPNWIVIPHTVIGDQNSATVEPLGTRFFRLKTAAR